MKYVLIFAGVIVAVPLVVWCIGLMLPESHTATLSRTYPAPSSEIYRMLTDVKQFPQWRSNVKEVEILADDDSGFEWREFYTDNDPITFRLADKGADSTRIVSEIADENLPFGGTWTYRLEALDDSTRLTITEKGEVYNPIFRFVSRFVMGYEGTINQYLADVEHGLGDD